MVNKVLVVGSLASSLKNFRGDLIQAMLKYGAVIAGAPEIKKDKATALWLVENGVKAVDISLSRTGLNPKQDLLTFYELLRLMWQVKPDQFLGYTIKPLIWGLIAAWICRIPRRTALITGLGYAFTGEAKGKRAFIQAMALFLYRFALRRATLIFFQNPDDKEDFARYNLLPKGIPVIVVNGSGVNTDKFKPVPFPPPPLKFLMIARLLGDKGVREYVAAAADIRRTHPEIEFHLVGGLDSNPDGIDEDEVNTWSDSGYVVWHGNVTDVRPAIQNAHVYVLPSYREGTPRTVLEAMAMGRPIITTDAPGCRETVVHDLNGYLIAPRSVEALIKAMYKFIESPQLISEMGRMSRLQAEQKYDVHLVNSIMLREMGIVESGV